MEKTTKARKYHSPLIKGLLDEITPLEMRQTKERMLLATRIEELVRSKGLKNKQFAEKVGKNPSEITKWLSGTHNFTMDVLTEIGEALGVEVSAFFGKREIQLVYREKFVVRSETMEPTILVTTPLGWASGSYCQNTRITFGETFNSQLQYFLPNG